MGRGVCLCPEPLPSLLGLMRAAPLSKLGWAWPLGPRGRQAVGTGGQLTIDSVYIFPGASLGLPVPSVLPPSSQLLSVFPSRFSPLLIYSASVSSEMPGMVLSPSVSSSPQDFSRRPYPSLFFLPLLSSLISSVISGTRKCSGREQPWRCQLFAQGGVGEAWVPGLGWVECGLGGLALLWPCPCHTFCLLPSSHFPLLVPKGGREATRHWTQPLQMLLC